ncbi:MAG: RNA polymerase sigma factor [Rhodocyclaceae bacterium]|nr:MAG: RNA polymerase sigma factor [Rhodocyclaceae bacterium]
MQEEDMIRALQSDGRTQDQGLQALYRKAAEFRRYFVRHGQSQDAAEDLVQETIIKIFRSVGQFSGGAGFSDASANAWLWTIARNTLIDSQRKSKQVLVSIDDDGIDESSQHALQADLAKHNPHGVRIETPQECVERGLDAFAAEHPDRARALEMQMDGEDVASIARRIGRTVAAAKEYLSQCKKKLAPYIEPCLGLLSA